MKTDPELVGACFKVIDRLVKHGVGTNAGAYSFMLTVGDKVFWELATIAELVAFADALDFAEARPAKAVAAVKTDAEICMAFDIAGERLDVHGVTLTSEDGRFGLEKDGTLIHETNTVEGLTLFVAALDLAKGEADVQPETAATDPPGAAETPTAPRTCSDP